MTRSKINSKKILKKKWKFLFFTIASGILFIILPTLIINYYTHAAPYRPPPPPPPIPPPEESPPRDFPEFIATPTPCIPNWCFVKQTSCCFDPICVFLSETDKVKNNRCPNPKPEEAQFMGSKKPANLNEENPNVLFSILNLFFKKR